MPMDDHAHDPAADERRRDARGRLSHRRHARAPSHGPGCAPAAAGERRAHARAARRRRPRGSDPFADVLAELERDVLPYRARGDHPGFFAFISYCGTWPGALGDFVASAANVYASTWLESAGPSQVELEVLGWFKEWIGYPPTAAGILVSGGSAANMTALACARESLVGPMSDDLVAYVPDQAHSSRRPRRSGARLPALAGARPARRRRVQARSERRSAERSSPIEPPGCGRSSSPSAVAARAPGRSIRCRRSPRSAAPPVPGCTSMLRTVASRR